MRTPQSRKGLLATGRALIAHSKHGWGMINGKLSALRWVLGDDWDMLDT
jgi:hypothetical protein